MVQFRIGNLKSVMYFKQLGQRTKNIHTRKHVKSTKIQADVLEDVLHIKTPQHQPGLGYSMLSMVHKLVPDFSTKLALESKEREVYNLSWLGEASDVHEKESLSQQLSRYFCFIYGYNSNANDSEYEHEEFDGPFHHNPHIQIHRRVEIESFINL